MVFSLGLPRWRDWLWWEVETRDVAVGTTSSWLPKCNAFDEPNQEVYP